MCRWVCDWIGGLVVDALVVRIVEEVPHSIFFSVSCCSFCMFETIQNLKDRVSLIVDTIL